MSNDQELIDGAVDRTAETIRAYVQQIESGDYGNTWTVYDSDDNVIAEDIEADSEGDAIEAAEAGLLKHAWAERNYADEPTVGETPIYEYPLEIVDRRGHPFAVVIGTGGPHIEVVAEGWQSARLEGYWGGSRATRYGDEFSTFLDYFIDRDDEA